MKRSGKKSDFKRPVKYESMRLRIEALLAENEQSKTIVKSLTQ